MSDFSLAELVELASEKLGGASGRELALVAARGGYRVSHATLNRIRHSTYSSAPSPETIRAVAYLAGVSEDVAFKAAEPQQNPDAPLTRDDVRAIVREEIETWWKFGGSVSALKRSESLLKRANRLNDIRVHSSDVQVESAEVVVEPQRVDPVDETLSDRESVRNVGQLRKVHESSPSAGGCGDHGVGESGAAGESGTTPAAPSMTSEDFRAIVREELGLPNYTINTSATSFLTNPKLVRAELGRMRAGAAPSPVSEDATVTLLRELVKALRLLGLPVTEDVIASAATETSDGVS